MSPFRATLCLLIVALAAPQVPAQPGESLPPAARMRLGSGGMGLEQPVSAGALSPDGKYVAAGSAAGVSLFERATGKRLAQVGELAPAPVMLLQFAPAGNILAVASVSNITLVEVPSGKVLHQLEVNEENFKRAQGLSFSADGKTVAVGMYGAGSNKRAKAFVWDVASGKSLGEVEVAQNNGCSTALSPDGKTLATWGRHVARMVDEDETPVHTIQLWEVATGKELRRIDTERPGVVITAGAFAPDGKTFIVGSGSALFQVFDPHSGKEVRRFAGRRAVVSSLRFSPDGRLLVAGGEGTIQAWRTTDGKRLSLSAGPKLRVLSYAFPGGDHVIALSGAGQSLMVWDAASGAGSQNVVGHHAPLIGLAYTGDGKLLRSLSQDGKVLSWDAASGKLRHETSIMEPDAQRYTGSTIMLANNLALSQDGRFAATKSIYSTIRLWDLATGEVACDFEPGKRPTMLGLAFSVDGTRLATAMMNQIHVYNTEAGQEVAKLPYPAPANGMANGAPRLAYAPDGKRLAVVNTFNDPNDNTAVAHFVLLDALTGKELRTADVPLPAGPGTPQGQAPAIVAFSPDIRFMAIPGGDRTVLLLHAASGKEYRRLTLSGAAGAINAIVFSPDGRTVAVAHGGDAAMGPMGERLAASAARIELCELASGTARATFAAHVGGVNCLTFAPDSLTLASGGADTTVLLWDAAPAPPVKSLALTVKDLAGEWPKLAQGDGQVAFGAMRRLVGSPPETVAFLKQQLHPANVADVAEKQIAGWVTDLDSDNFDKRDGAFRALEKVGVMAEAALRKARTGNISLEMRRRIDDLVDKIERGRLTDDELQTVRAVEVLERIGTAPARDLLTALAGGAPSAVLTREARQALARLRIAQ
jgi:WD40 repeat protein